MKKGHKEFNRRVRELQQENNKGREEKTIFGLFSSVPRKKEGPFFFHLCHCFEIFTGLSLEFLLGFPMPSNHHDEYHHV